jgi:hypothetical protein
MDADGDGRVTAAEMDASHGAMSGGSGSARMSSVEKIEVIDTDKDGVLTASEHASGSRERFAKMDGDGDGSLTPAELEAGHQKLMSDQPR